MCEDYPHCGHEMNCCPDFNEDGEQMNMKCICGANVPLNSAVSMCEHCLRNDPDDCLSSDISWDDNMFPEDIDLYDIDDY